MSSKFLLSPPDEVEASLKETTDLIIISAGRMLNLVIWAMA
jgi:hypothetical protein